jgi:hypothetical protein
MYIIIICNLHEYNNMCMDFFIADTPPVDEEMINESGLSYR